MGGFEKGFAQNFGSTGRSSGYGAKMTEKEKAELKARRDAGFYDVETGDERTEREELAEDLSTAYDYKKGEADKLARGELYKGKPLKGAFVEEERKAVKSRARKLKWESKQTKAKAQQEQVKFETDKMIFEGAKSIPNFGKKSARIGLNKARAEQEKLTAEAAKSKIEAEDWGRHFAQKDANDTTRATADIMSAQAQMMNAQAGMNQTIHNIKSAEDRVRAVESVSKLQAAFMHRMHLGKKENQSPAEFITELSHLAHKIPNIVSDRGVSDKLSTARSSIWNAFTEFRKEYKASKEWEAGEVVRNNRAMAVASINQSPEHKAEWKAAQEGGYAEEYEMYHFFSAHSAQSGVNVPLNEKAMSQIIVQRQHPDPNKRFHKTYVDGREVPMVDDKGRLIVNYQVDVAESKRNYLRYVAKVKAEQEKYSVEVTQGTKLMGGTKGSSGVQFGPTAPTPPTEHPFQDMKLTGGPNLAPLAIQPATAHDPLIMQKMLDAITDPRADIDPMGTLGGVEGTGEALDARSAAGLGLDVEAFKEPVDYGFGEPEAPVAPVAPVEPVAPAPVAPAAEPEIDDMSSSADELREEIKSLKNSGFKENRRNPIDAEIKTLVSEWFDDHKEWKRQVDTLGKGDPALLKRMQDNKARQEKLVKDRDEIIPQKEKELDDLESKILDRRESEKAMAGKKEAEARGVHARRGYPLMRRDVDYVIDAKRGTITIEGGVTESVRKEIFNRYRSHWAEDAGKRFLEGIGGKAKWTDEASKKVASSLTAHQTMKVRYSNLLKKLESELASGFYTIGKERRKLTLAARKGRIKERDDTERKIKENQRAIDETKEDLDMLDALGNTKTRTISIEEARKLGIIK